MEQGRVANARSCALDTVCGTRDCTKVVFLRQGHRYQLRLFQRGNRYQDVQHMHTRGYKHCVRDNMETRKSETASWTELVGENSELPSSCADGPDARRGLMDPTHGVNRVHMVKLEFCSVVAVRSIVQIHQQKEHQRHFFHLFQTICKILTIILKCSSVFAQGTCSEIWVTGREDR